MENFYFYLVLLLPLFFLISQSFRRRYNLPPSPQALPVIGHLYLMFGNACLIRDNPEVFFHNLLRKFGSVLFLRFGSQPVLVVSCPNAVKECFTGNDGVFADRPKTLASDCLSYDYKVVSFVPNNDLWKTLRGLTHDELFSPKSLDKSATLRQEENADLIRSLRTMTTTAVSLRSWFYLLVLNIATRVVSGGRSTEVYEKLETEEGRKSLEDLREILRPHLPFSACDFFPILRAFRFMGQEKDMKMLQEKRDAFLQAIMDEFQRKKSSSPPSNTSQDKTSTFIETLYQKRESDPNLYDEDMIKALLLTMFVAGTETSALTMEWAISLLLDHPEAMNRLREEIQTEVGTDRLLHDKDLDNMKFLQSVVLETLRLHPPVKLILPHMAKKQCKVMDYDIPEGTILLVNAWAMHRDPKVWVEPGKFKPDRFESLKPNQTFTNIPFGKGRRACPGEAMALKTILLTVGSLVQCFDLQKVTSDPHGRYLCTPRSTTVHV